MLHPIEIPPLEAFAVSAEAAELIAEAERRIEQFQYDRAGRVIHAFVASDYRAVDVHLRWIAARHLAPGRMFCEWGSGFGVVTLLAAMHGFDACGIEVEPELVEQAQKLADDFRIPAQFLQGSVLPDAWDRLDDYLVEAPHLDIDSPSAYDELGLEIADFDLIFAFPWPGEEQLWEDLFNDHAAAGSLLLTYHGRDQLRLSRKR